VYHGHRKICLHAYLIGSHVRNFDRRSIFLSLVFHCVLASSLTLYHKLSLSHGFREQCGGLSGGPRVRFRPSIIVRFESAAPSHHLSGLPHSPRRRFFCFVPLFDGASPTELSMQNVRFHRSFRAHRALVPRGLISRGPSPSSRCKLPT